MTATWWRAKGVYYAASAGRLLRARVWIKDFVYALWNTRDRGLARVRKAFFMANYYRGKDRVLL